MKLEKKIELCDSLTPLETEIASYIVNNKDTIMKLKILFSVVIIGSVFIFYIVQQFKSSVAEMCNNI